MKRKQWKHGFWKAAVLLLALLLFAGCSSSTTSDLTQACEDTVSSQINQELSEKTSTLQEESEVRNGTQEDRWPHRLIFRKAITTAAVVIRTGIIVK